MKTTLKSSPQTTRAFTLIELLIVISIIALLAAILFPVFTRVRENARRTNCSSNLKQMGIGILQYAQDYDEIMVPAYLDGSCYAAGGFSVTNAAGCSNNFKWMDLIYPYVKSEQVFNCPSVKSDFRPYDYASGDEWGHYAANMAYYGPNNGSDTVNPPFSQYRETSPGTFLRKSPINLSRIQAPATTVMVLDSRRAAPAPFWMIWDNIGGVTPTTSPTLRDVGVDTNEPNARTFVGSNSAVAERHLSTINVLWADGHVKPVNMDTITQTKTIAVSTNGGTPTNKAVYTAWTIEDD